MNISVCILTYNEEKNIRECLESIINQKYLDGEWEVLVVDGMSSDKTLEIVHEFQKYSDRIKLIINEEKKIAAGRNKGIIMSRYPFIAFTDADCIVPEDWLHKLSKAYKEISLKDDMIVGVGGANVPPHNSPRFTKALGVYLNSFLGAFNSPQGRNFRRIRAVASLACLNVIYKKELLKKIGMFDVLMGNIAEDRDINIRLNKQGYNLYFIPGAEIYHKFRLNLMSWLKNMALYGKGRAIVTFKYNLFMNIFFFLPMLFIIFMIMVPLGFIYPVLFLSLLYFPFILLYAIYMCYMNKMLSFIPTVLVIFITTHFVYAFNLLIVSLEIGYKKVIKKIL